MAFGLQDYDGRLCPYCGHPMEIGARWFPTRDHVYPRHLGGTRHEENVLIVCSPCNQDKGGKTLIQFARSLTNKQDSRAARVWAIFKSRPSFHAGETSRIVSGWEKARRAAEQIAERARKNGQEHAP